MREKVLMMCGVVIEEKDRGAGRALKRNGLEHSLEGIEHIV